MKYSAQPREDTADESPPSRGAWIEIVPMTSTGYVRRSPPSRGAWIEIRKFKGLEKTESRRPPRGGRGLK